jgi:hypothetical protein
MRDVNICAQPLSHKKEKNNQNIEGHGANGHLIKSIN